MNMYAKVIADSISTTGVRLVTFELKYPRFIHSEIMTHRMFSRNSRSNRFCSNSKMVEEVRKDYVIPTELSKFETATGSWANARASAVYHSKELTNIGVSKEITNRIIEPFQYIYTVCSATEWDNFFHLRLAEDAQPEIRFLAQLMKDAMSLSYPQYLINGQWHTPYVSNDDFTFDQLNNGDHIKCSVARCARVSYSPFNATKADVTRDIELYDKLLSSKHMSPFEHVATPIKYPWHEFDTMYSDPVLVENDWETGTTHIDKRGYFWSGNFKSWIQYRHIL